MKSHLSLGPRMRIEFLPVNPFAEARFRTGAMSGWDTLAGDNPFRRAAWLDSWWQAFGQTVASPYVLAILDEDADVSTDETASKNETLIGLVPWVMEKTSGDGRRLRPLGSGEVCSDHHGFHCDPGDAERIANAVAEWLHDAAWGRHGEAARWDTIRLDCTPATEPTLAPLMGALARRGHVLADEPGLNIWRLTLPATWDDYLATLSKSHRKQLRHLDRDYLANGRCRLVDVSVDGGEETSFATGFAILVDLHQRRRATLGQPGCFADPRFTRFLSSAGERLLAEGRLQLTWMLLDGTPVAAEFHLTSPSTVYAYQAGVDPDRMDDEPGRVFTIAIMRRAIEQGKIVLDFLRGDEPYKAHWGAQPLPTRNVRIAANHVSAQVRHGVWMASKNVKQWIKTAVGGKA